MFFLKKQVKPSFGSSEEQASPAETPEQRQVENASGILESMATPAGAGPSNRGVNLFSKLFRNQKLDSGPDYSFENEAWAPEYQGVRLFRKQRSTVEEQISSPSGPQ